MISSAGQRPAILPWQAEPHRLWSLLDMKRFYAAAFSTAFIQLEFLQGDALYDSDDPAAEARWRAKAKGVLSDMAKECEDAQFTRLAERSDRLSGQVTHTPILPMLHLIRDLVADVQQELTRHLYFLVPENRKSWYREDDVALFGDRVGDAFPESTPEVAEAGRCYALGRWTATVFHLMRALEIVLHKWALDMGVTQFSAIELENWKNIIDAADKKIRALEQQPKSPQKDAELQYYGETTAHFRSIKDAWRNHVSHSRTSYDDRQAQSIMRHVSEFMNLLAARP